MSEKLLIHIHVRKAKKFLKYYIFILIFAIIFIKDKTYNE